MHKQTSRFNRIGLFAKHNNSSVLDTLEKLIHFLQKRGHTLSIETQSAALLSNQGNLDHNIQIIPKEYLGEAVDLVIVIGGDGSLLNAARAIVAHQVPVVGINRGRLGFLADILPENMEQELNDILEGHYLEEQRFLLNARIIRHGKIVAESTALNDVVLYTGSIARMVDFEVYINDHFVLRQQADGIITATPTGSTAYALSAGGPILYPTLKALTITPLCPHTLSSRPIVVDSDSDIRLVVTQNNDIKPKLSCDGQSHFDLEASDQISIQKYPFELTLIHPKTHEYFSVLREKLGWSTQ
ncbi:MAG TPA: NAD(+) kinase [Gammaproteobacteria bacterium]|nr:NAD(+) kinase [Gammaproteobacteria bacterium]HRA43253.1 NAD(+) kinase [Gammaproteobacteria bacterium]